MENVSFMDGPLGRKIGNLFEAQKRRLHYSLLSSLKCIFFLQEAEVTFAAEDSTDDSSTLSRMVILAPSVQRWSFPVEPQGASQEGVTSAEIQLMNDKIIKY